SVSLLCIRALFLYSALQFSVRFMHLVSFPPRRSSDLDVILVVDFELEFVLIAAGRIHLMRIAVRSRDGVAEQCGVARPRPRLVEDDLLVELLHRCGHRFTLPLPPLRRRGGPRPVRSGSAGSPRRCGTDTCSLGSRR